jgi:uncharacterized protein
MPFQLLLDRHFFYLRTKPATMKKRTLFSLSFILLLMLPFTGLLAQSNPAKDWSMKTYYMVILKTGPDRAQDSTERAQIQAAHLANMGKMYDEKKLVLAGPFLDDSPLAGIFVFDVATVEEAEELAKSDPAVVAGRLIYEVHPWYGPSTLHF